jgi:hypothetical protein
MLASTVQFSSYGRAPQLSSAYLDERGGSSGADGPSCRPRGQTEEGFRPFPQDPTVCLVVYPVHAVPIQLTGCTDAYELHNDWSMFHP